jgi:hypothetical protein
MTYKIQGVELLIQPTSGNWLARNAVGMDALGHSIYPPYRQFQMQWDLMSPTGTQQLQNYFSLVNNTGTANVDLPQYGAGDYQFRTYSGCILQEPEWNVYFSEYITRVTMLVTRIRT